MRWRAADGRVLQGWLGGAGSGPLVAVLHGASTPHASTHATVADDLAEVAAALGDDRFAVLGMSVGGGYAVACAVRHPDRVTALGLVSAQPPGRRTEPPEVLAEEVAPEFLAWRAGVAPDDPDDDALVARWLTMLPPADAALVAARPVADVAAHVWPVTTHLAALVAHWPEVLDGLVRTRRRP